VLVTTAEEFNDAITYLSNYDEWVIDCETNGLYALQGNQLCGVGVGVEGRTYYFPFRHQTLDSNLDSELLPKLMEVMNTCKTVVGYNIKFDLKFLEKEGLDVQDKALVDVIVMVRLTESTNVNALNLTDTLIRRYGPEAGAYDIETKQLLRKNKWTKDFSLCPPDILGPYCEKDVEGTARLYADCKDKIIRSKQEKVWKLEVDLTKVLYSMECAGVAVDNKYVESSLDKLNKRSKEVLQNIYNISGDEFNVASVAQVGEVFAGLGISSPQKTLKGRDSWSEGALVQINHPLAGWIRQYRTLAKLISTYIEPYRGTSTMHTTYANWGTVTGRLSSREPNLQNIPRNHFKLHDVEFNTEAEIAEIQGRVDAIIAAKGQNVSMSAKSLRKDVLEVWGFVGDESLDETNDKQLAIRRMFKPRPDHYLVSYDYSQMEVRMFMNYIGNPDMLELMKHGDVDFHGEAAKIAFKVDKDHPEYKFYRQLAKTITFGVIYGIGKDKLAGQLNTSPKEAGKYKAEYFKNITGSKKFFDSVVRMVEQRGWVKSKYDRIYKVDRDKGYRAVNYLIQGTSADLLSERMIEVDKFLTGTNSKMLLQVHDEIICEIHKDDALLIPQIRDILQENSLGIPLMVDMELCEPSWATKHDFQVQGGNVVYANAPTPVAVAVKEYIDWS
jgi:DNA polymerase-1